MYVEGWYGIFWVFKGGNEPRFVEQWGTSGGVFGAQLRTVRRDCHCFHPLSTLPEKRVLSFSLWSSSLKRKSQSSHHSVDYIIEIKSLSHSRAQRQEKKCINMMILLNVWEPWCQKLQVQSLVLVSQIIKQTTCFCWDNLFDSSNIKDFHNKKFTKKSYLINMLLFNYGNF